MGLQTDTSADPDSEVENERQKTKAAKDANQWGSLVNVMYGINKEKDMKLNPQYFITRDSMLNANRRRGFRTNSSNSSIEAQEESKSSHLGDSQPLKDIFKERVNEFSTN